MAASSVPLGVEGCGSVALGEQESSALLHGWEVPGFQEGWLVEVEMVLHPFELHSMDTTALCAFSKYRPQCKCEGVSWKHPHIYTVGAKHLSTHSRHPSGNLPSTQAL